VKVAAIMKNKGQGPWGGRGGQMKKEEEEMM